jgi:hypothetical protein
MDVELIGVELSNLASLDLEPGIENGNVMV